MNSCNTEYTLSAGTEKIVASCRFDLASCRFDLTSCGFDQGRHQLTGLQESRTGARSTVAVRVERLRPSAEFETGAYTR